MKVGARALPLKSPSPARCVKDERGFSFWLSCRAALCCPLLTLFARGLYRIQPTPVKSAALAAAGLR
ncbi:MAG: hypothetical protein KME26_19045 [Oscillatoria princeps RMCB-10]|nr:hypothetical protein [Oscillatoria princeps RMCB-10]